MKRRELLATMAATAFTAGGIVPSAAHGVGIAGPSNLVDALYEAVAIEEGGGPNTVHILFSVTCYHSRNTHAAVRRHLGSARFRWIPVSLGTAGGDAEISGLLADPTPGTLAEVLRAGPVPNAVATPAAARQAAVVQGTIAPLLFSATRRPLGTPTLVYRDEEAWRVRVVRGAVRLPTLAEIVDAAV